MAAFVVRRRTPGRNAVGSFLPCYAPRMPFPSAAPRAMTTPSIVVMLTLLLGIQLAALIIAFGLGQLVCGPLADRFGRRPVLLVGLSLYTLTSFASAAAASIETLIAWRALQGAAMAAAVTCGRSIVRDLFELRPGHG